MKSLTHFLLAAGCLVGAGGAFAADVPSASIAAWERGDYGTAVREWRPLAERGDADAQFNLGQAYKMGRGVPADPKIARSWYEKAAAQGHERAQAYLGVLLFQDGKRAEAMPWIRKAAERGDARSQYVLGTAMFNGDLAEKDWPRAYALMTRASAQGLPQAKDSLVEMDRYIPLDQREKGVAMARKMESGEAILAANVNPPAFSRRSTPVNPIVAPSGRPEPVAEPAPRPAPPKAAPPKAAAPTKVTSGKWRVQLGAYSSDANARRQWDNVRGKVSALGAHQPLTSKAGALTRLQAGPLASRAAADRLCAAVKAAGQPCFVVAP